MGRERYLVAQRGAREKWVGLPRAAGVVVGEESHGQPGRQGMEDSEGRDVGGGARSWDGVKRNRRHLLGSKALIK